MFWFLHRILLAWKVGDSVGYRCGIAVAFWGSGMSVKLSSLVIASIGDHLWVAIPSRYVISQLHEPSLAFPGISKLSTSFAGAKVGMSPLLCGR